MREIDPALTAMTKPAADITLEEALALCTKKWGPGSVVAVLDMGGPDVTPFERDAARLQLATHDARRPVLVSEENVPPGTTIGEYRADRERWHEELIAWEAEQARLLSIAYRYRFRVEGPSKDAVATSRHARPSFDRDGFSFRERGEGYSWQEALERADVVPGSLNRFSRSA